jgi:hypothetical protein
MSVSSPSVRLAQRVAVLVFGVLAVGLLHLSVSVADSKGPPAATDLDKDHAAKMARGLDLFNKSVRTLLTDKCLRCHGGKSTESGFDLSDRDKLLKGGERGPAVLLGRGKESLLYKLIAHTKEPHMPHERPKLPDDAVAQVAAWIDNGAPYSEPLVARTVKEQDWTRTVVPASAKAFWSFQPLKRPDPPRVKDGSWCRTSVDRFILAGMEAARVKPNAPVDRRRLIRRASFDLLGLPPSPADIEAFVDDPDPDAYGKLIDRLLGSQHYGERWARHWLDLARFAESHGFEHDSDRPSAYHYRDFVIRALNEGLPYDTFVKWQLAGDEYEPGNNLALAATGFLAAGVHSTQITKNEVEKHRYDELDDIVSTIGTSMLGLTIGCCRCHDHKYDPLPTGDYYRLLANFTTTVRSEVDLTLDADAFQKARAAFDREHAPLVAALQRFEAEELPARLAAWEKIGAAELSRSPWVVLDLTSFRSAGGATFTKLNDGSLLATGKNPTFDTYLFTAKTDRQRITAIRLEALADPSLSHGGPGRAGNGNFALSDVTLTMVPLGSAGTPLPDARPVPVKWRNARATFEQKGLPVAAAIDNDAKSAWAVDPQFGKDHAAVFETDEIVGGEGGTLLTFTLKFNNNGGHNIGRPRLSMTTLPGPVALDAGSAPQTVLQALKTPSDLRSNEQSAALLSWHRHHDRQWSQLNQAVEAHVARAPKPTTVKALICSEGLPAVRLNTQGVDFFKETYFLRRGDPNMKEGVVAPGFLQVLMPSVKTESRWLKARPAGWRTSYRRRAVAEWITDVDQGAGRLLARVIVNRLWQHHMGRGLVATPSDFGVRGEKPTHPELLDWLATELIAGGWKLKSIHKLIMTSAVYQQDSRSDETRLAADRDNRLYWRRPVRRLEAEAIRDSLLAVSGVLDTRMYGPGTLDEGSKRRSIYFTVKRSKLMPMMVVFDMPDALTSMGERPTTTIAPQALYLLNDPQVRTYAHAFARRVGPDAKTSAENSVTAAYRIALGRPPTAEELADALSFVKNQAESYAAAGKADARELALTDFCQTLMCLNDFVYVD